jgi:alpha-glucosidase (family GH31 glycosyl hydrolase)
MVEESIHDFRPFVHSDCGAGETNASAVLRWTAHCVLGTILRFHGADHAPWLFDNTTQAVIRKYLAMRYALAPSLIAAGRVTQQQGLPLAARCDLFWPTHHAARSNTQYISTFAEALVAPLNETQMSRSVWIPPGEWREAWSGKAVVGPCMVNVIKPWDQIPMWHRVGALVITTDSKALRIGAQDWQHLTIHTWPAAAAANASKDLYFGDDSSMSVALQSDGYGGVQVRGTADAAARTWLLRLHLAEHERLSGATVDGATLVSPARHLEPAHDCAEHYFPFAGAGATPPCDAGSIVEIEIQAGKSGWIVRATISQR